MVYIWRIIYKKRKYKMKHNILSDGIFKPFDSAPKNADLDVVTVLSSQTFNFV